jgi:hypothetical protein
MPDHGGPGRGSRGGQGADLRSDDTRYIRDVAADAGQHRAHPGHIGSQPDNRVLCVLAILDDPAGCLP